MIQNYHKITNVIEIVGISLFNLGDIYVQSLLPTVFVQDVFSLCQNISFRMSSTQQNRHFLQLEIFRGIKSTLF